MKAVLCIGVAMVLATCPTASADALYRCSAKSVQSLQDDGTLAPFPTNFWLEHWSNFLIDTTTGLLRRSKAAPEQLAVIQRGSGQNDFVASPRATPVSAATDVLRVRAWDRKPQVTFYALNLSMIVAGSCEAVQ